MFDLMVVAKGGRWVLVDDEAGEVGAFDSRAEALRAAGDYEFAADYLSLLRDELSYVLVHDHETGEWDEAAVEIPRLQ